MVWICYLIFFLACALLVSAIWRWVRKTLPISECHSVRNDDELPLRLGRVVPGSSAIPSRNPRPFGGNPLEFKQWAFAVELAMTANNITTGEHQILFVSSLLEDNALLWFMACKDAGTTFEEWTPLKGALAEAFGPLQEGENHRLALFSISQNGSLDAYIRDFSCQSLCVPELDEHTRALLFVQGLRENTRGEALRQHPKTLSEAIRAARIANHYSLLKTRPERKNVQFKGRQEANSEASTRTYQRRGKLTDSERFQLMKEGRCFKCRASGHLAKDCPERSAQGNELCQ